MPYLNQSACLAASTAMAMVMALSATPVQAQDLTTPLGRIVLGWGTSQVAIDTPQAVTVIDEAELEQQQATTLAEIFDTVPGMQAIGSDRVAGMSFNIRGIGELASADESRIIVQVDGVSSVYEQYRMGSFFSDPELFRQVEILRGPASATLYGSGAIGGVVRFETRDPQDFLSEGSENALRFRLAGESNGEGALASVIYATAPSERFDALVALNYRRSEEYVDGNGTEIEGSAFDASSGLMRGRLRFGDDLEQSLTASYRVWDSQLDDTAYSQTGTQAFGTVDRDIRDQSVSLRYQYDASAPWLNLDATLSYTDTQVEQRNASSTTPSVLFDDSEYAYRTLALDVVNTTTSAGAGWENTLTYGLQASQQDRVAIASSGAVSFHPEGLDTRLGLFVQSEFALDNGLTIIPGLRADFIEQEPSAASIAEGARDRDDVVFSPKIAAQYDINGEWSVFGSLARTERAPTLDELFSYDADEDPSLQLVAETADTIEAGFTWSRGGVFTSNDALDLRFTAFHSDISDMITRSNNASTPYHVNIGAVTTSGYEIEAAYEAEAHFARLALSDVYGEDKATGLTPTSIPQRSLSMTIGRRWREQGLQIGWRGLFTDGIEYSATDQYGGYAVHDLFAEWQPQSGPLEGIAVQFGIDNIADRTYRNSLSQDNGRGRSYRVALTRAVQW
ncbi:TonB-dependent receptor domain-containing protein [Rhodophyticola sp. SM2404]